ncbi:hypothetical protein C3V39_02685 [Prevotella sp. oral taxon 820]|nr:hypothetical protein C3V39_02685 [Prevotella sp. oral taxon 820]
MGVSKEQFDRGVIEAEKQGPCIPVEPSEKSLHEPLKCLRYFKTAGARSQILDFKPLLYIVDNQYVALFAWPKCRFGLAITGVLVAFCGLFARSKHCFEQLKAMLLSPHRACNCSLIVFFCVKKGAGGLLELLDESCRKC